MQAAQPGAMTAIEASEEEILESLDAVRGTVGVAAINGPGSTVISGDRDAVEQLARQWTEQGRRATELQVNRAFHSAHMAAVCEGFRDEIAGLRFELPQIRVVSSVTGEIDGEALTSAQYWADQIVRPVRFLDGIQQLEHAGATEFIELGPDAVLTTLAGMCVSEVPGSIMATQRGDELGPSTLNAVLAVRHLRGGYVDWTRLLPAARPAPLPTYPFARDRYWFQREPGAGTVTELGLDTTGHPLLGAALDLSDGATVVFSGQVSRRSHPWLGEHEIAGVPLLPAAAFVELVTTAGHRTGQKHLEELSITAPLALPAEDPVTIQVTVSGPDTDNRRSVTVAARTSTAGSWVEHANGRFGAAASVKFGPAEKGPDEFDPHTTYMELAERGYGYGPAFRGLRDLWRDGNDLVADIALADGLAGNTQGFAVHPSLLDAALHPILLENSEMESGMLLLPFSWSGVTIHESTATQLRVRMRLGVGGDGAVTAQLQIADEEGREVVSVDELLLRPVPRSSLLAAASADAHFRQAWITAPERGHADAAEVVVVSPSGQQDLLEPGTDLYTSPTALLQAVEEGRPVPDIAFMPVPLPNRGTVPEDATDVLQEMLQFTRAWILDSRLEGTRLVVTTRGAVAALPEETPDLRQAAVWGLLRSAATESPGRFGLLDLDTSTVKSAPHELVLASATGNQVAVRGEDLLVPRLLRGVGAATTSSAPDWAAGTVLITGASGTLGSRLAVHLASEHGARHLLLLSRRGADAPNASALMEELASVGAKATFAAVDVADREQLAQLLDHPPIDVPVRAVVHTAGLVEDGVLSGLDNEQLRRVLRPKIDAAWHLHELTADLPLEAFVLYSSVAGLIGTAGQANYAAANTFLDALATSRRAHGRPATSLAWGLWEAGSELSSGLDEVDLRRLERVGVLPLAAEEGLGLFDAALLDDAPVSVLARLDLAGLSAGVDDPPEVFEELIHRIDGAASEEQTHQTGLAEQLTTLNAAEQAEVVTELVRAQVSRVLGHADDAQVDPRRRFQDLGLDSLAAVELRNQLREATGLRLPATLVFDHPSPADLAIYLQEELVPSATSDTDTPTQEQSPAAGHDHLKDATDDELFAMVDALE